jgi:hypothetical protein
MGAGVEKFKGRTFDQNGLVVRFQSLDLKPLFAGARFLLPVSRPLSSRWLSNWSPFGDTTGLHLCASIHVGAAVHGEVKARVVQDSSPEVPHLLPGETIPYYRRGALFWSQAMLGFTARLGAGERALISATLLAGLSWATAPASRGVSSESGPLVGIPLAMELSVHF